MTVPVPRTELDICLTSCLLTREDRIGISFDRCGNGGFSEARAGWEVRASGGWDTGLALGDRPCCVCRRFGTKCAGCAQGISPSDLVRKARGKVFHLNCFTCMVCNKQLSTGEELYVIDENKFVCKDDYLSSSSLKEGSLNSGRRPPAPPQARPQRPPAKTCLRSPPLPPACPRCTAQSSPLALGRSRWGGGAGAGKESQRLEPAFQDAYTASSNPPSSSSGAFSKLPSSPSLEPHNFPFPSLFSSW